MRYQPSTTHHNVDLVDFLSALPAWRQHAACVGHNTEHFFPSGSTGSASEDIAQAKAVCAGCKVRQQCLDYALDTGQQDGIWGGKLKTNGVACAANSSVKA